MNESDEELLQQASSGDGQALTQLFERHAPAVRSSIAGELPARFQSVLTVDDVMQECYTDAFLDIAEFEPRGPGAFRGWLTTIAKNNLRNAVEGLKAKKRGGDRKQIEPANPDDSFVGLYELLGATESTPSRKAAAHEARAALEHALDRLPADYQKVVRLYDLEDLPTEAVAEALDRRPGAVFMLRSRAHRALRQLMGGSSKYFSDSP